MHTSTIPLRYHETRSVDTARQRNYVRLARAVLGACIECHYRDLCRVYDAAPCSTRLESKDNGQQ